MILGKMLVYDGKFITLRTQLGCGAVMVLDSDECLYSARGPACCECTAALRSKPSLYRDFLTQYACHERQCVICNTTLTNPSTCFMYPLQTYMCDIRTLDFKMM